MVRFFKNTNIALRIILTSILLIAATVIVVSCLYYRYAHNDIKREYCQHSIKITKQDAMFYDKELRNLIKCIFDLKYNTHINNELNKFLVSKQGNYGTALTNIVRILTEVEQTENLISSIYIFTPEGDFYDYSNFKKPGFVFEQSELYTNLSKLGDSELYVGKAESNGIFQSKSTFIPLGMKYHIDGYSQWLYIIVFVNTGKMRSYFDSTRINNNNEIILINHSGDLVLGNNSEITQSFLSDKPAVKNIISSSPDNDNPYLSIDGYLVTYQALNVVPWYIVNIQSEEALMKNILSLKKFIYIISVTSILISIVLSIFISVAIVRPLKTVENTIHKVTDGDFNVQCSYTNENEVGRLGRSFNFMVAKIRDLIERLNQTIQELEIEKKKVEEEQELKRTAELKALQAQINPHFLYNTLSAITWMAYERGATDIYKIASGLGDFYRIALSKGQEIISLRDEIKHVENYLAIQKYRYGQKLQYSFDIDEDALEYASIKLILQPLVENAIYHGINAKENQGHINISVSYIGVSRELELDVYDNGAGIEQKALDDINKKLCQGEKIETKGYGIFNVNERIKLIFGKKYGLRLESKRLEGTHAIITLPALYIRDMKEVNQNV